MGTWETVGLICLGLAVGSLLISYLGGKFERCKHQWETITDKVIPNSFMERKIASAKGLSTEDILDTHILVQKCTKCGKMDKTITKV